MIMIYLVVVQVDNQLETKLDLSSLPQLGKELYHCTLYKQRFRILFCMHCHLNHKDSLLQWPGGFHPTSA